MTRPTRKPAVLAALALLAAGGLTACAEEDVTPPPAPRLDPVRSPTSLATQVLAGSAEYASTVRIAREPAFSDEETAAYGPFELQADPFTAGWRLELPLAADAENVFTVTAADAAGNVSEATEARVAHESPRAEHLRLALDSSIVDAAAGRLTARAQALNAEDGVPLEDLEIRFDIVFTSGGPGEAVAPLTAATDAEGRAEVTFEGLNTTGAGTLTATGVLGGAADSADFLVRGGSPTTLSLELLAGTDGTPAKAVDVDPGTAVTARITILDAPQNVLNVPFRLYTDAPGARLVGNTLQGITEAGSWHVMATVEGQAGAEAGLLVSDEATLTVHPGAADRVELSLGAPSALAGEAVPISARALDAYGNAVDGLSPLLASSDADAAFTGDAVTHTRAGTKVITASVDLDGDGTADVQATAGLDVLPAAPAAVTLTLDAADVDGQRAGLQLLPDTDVPLLWSVTDVYGNEVAAAVTVTTTAPGFLRGSTLVEVLQTGTYDVVARVEGTGLADVQALEVVPDEAAEIVLSLSNPEPPAGELVEVRTQARDAFGNAVPGAVIDLTTDVPAGGATIDPAAGTLRITAAGSFAVTAALAADPAVSATAPVRVSPGPTAAIDLQLTPAPAAVQAGEVVGYAVTVLDAYGNPTGDPVRLATDAPGAVIAGGQLANLVTAGSYHVWAEATGTGLSDMEALSVSAGSATTLDLSLAASAVRRGEPLAYVLSLVDGFGNPVAGTPSLTTGDPGAVIDTSASVIRFAATGLQEVTATFGGLTDVEPVLVMEVPDIAAPTAEIVAPAADESFVPGETLAVRVHATDDRTLASVRLQIRGAFSFDESTLVPTSPPTLDSTVTFDVRIPGGSGFGPATLTAAATDAAGNLTVGRPVIIDVSPSTLITVNGGTVTTLAGGPGSGLRSPWGVSLADSGELFVANSNRDNVVVLDPATGAITQFGPDLPASPRDVAYDPVTGGVFVSFWDRVAYIDAGGALTNPWSSTGNGFRPEGLCLIPGVSLLVADSNNDEVRIFDPTLAAVAAPNAQLGLFGVLNAPWGVAAGLDAAGHDVIYVGSEGGDEVWEYHPVNPPSPETLLRRIGDRPQIDRPREIITLSNDDLLVANENAGTVSRIDTGSCLSPASPCNVTVVASGFDRPFGLARSADGTRVYVTDRGWDAVFEITGSF